jgi:hypothetical protein
VKNVIVVMVVNAKIHVAMMQAKKMLEKDVN